MAAYDEAQRHRTAVAAGEVSVAVRAQKVSYKLEVLKARTEAMKLARKLIEEANAADGKINGYVLDAMSEVFRESRELQKLKDAGGFRGKGYGTKYDKKELAQALAELEGPGNEAKDN